MSRSYRVPLPLAAIGAQLPNWWEDGTGEFAGAPDAWAGTKDGKALLGLNRRYSCIRPSTQCEIQRTR